MQERNAPTCGREHDLIGFLYGEVSDVEKQSFKTHLNDCNICSSQIRDFRLVRESLIGWRDESLGGAYAGTTAPVVVPVQQSRSALTAFRAFFDLSPFWMKGAVGFAAVLFLLMTTLTVIQWRSVNSPAPKASNNAAYSADEFNKMVEKRVQEELARRTTAPVVGPQTLQPSVVASVNPAIHPKSLKISSRTNEVARNSQIQKAQRPLSRTEREQLAADLRLVSSASDRSLILLEDQINQ